MTFAAVASAFARAVPRDAPTTRPCAGLIDVTADTATLADAPFAKAHLRWLGDKGPMYPVDLRNARIEGEALATYVVDTLGRVMRNTAQITTESDRAFGESVCNFLTSTKFAPVVIDGRKRTVRVLDQHFKFRVD